MEALLKELSDIDYQLMRFGWGMQRSNVISDEDAQLTEVEEETNSDEESNPDNESALENSQTVTEQIRQTRREMFFRIYHVLVRWTQRHNIPFERRFLAIIRRIEIELWDRSNGSLDDYTNPVLLINLMRPLTQALSRRQQRLMRESGDS